jgi:hypothetical protein
MIKLKDLLELRIRNFPSIALFHDGSKKEVWKADMDAVFRSWMLGLHAKLKKAGVKL